MHQSSDSDFSLGDVQVFPSHNELMKRGQVVKLQPKVMAVLLYLARHHTRVISNEELIESLWEGRIVTHGSVQKSINALRSGLAELVGETEIIAHYSKRGYQLKIEPCFVGARDTEPTTQKLSRSLQASWRVSLLACVTLVFGGLIIYGLLNMDRIFIHKNHKTVFTVSGGYTNETGHERSAEPHPDNQHIAYVRERFNPKDLQETESELIIRNTSGQDWRLASSQGSWFKLAWSPAGKHLVAVEVKRQEGLPLTPNFYEKPNYLYSFHIFTLDLVHNRLIEKQLLSQWQGRIFSVTWWDESTLEFVAKQGPSSSNARYRYSIINQQLTQLDELEGISNPLASIVHQRKTAVVSRYKNAVQIDFLKADQSRISRWHLDFANVDVSWIPDGSGILIYAEEERQLLVLYLNGSQEVISLADAKDRVRSRPRYRANGQGIFYTDEIRGANIASLKMDGTEQKITQNADVNYGASFSPDGNRIVYVSIRNNQTQLWLVAAEKEYQQATDAIAARVSRIVWSMDGQHLAYSAGSKLYRYDISSGRGELVLDGKERLQVVAYLPDDGEYFVLKSNGETQNLWRIEKTGQNQKQLTFGAVGSAIVSEQGNVLFQYVGEKGLWTLRRDDDSLELLAKDFSANSQLLQADDRGVYYISGGMCRESDIMFLGYDQRAAETFLTRKNNIVLTSSFNKHQGVLYTECYLAESNIVLME